MQRHTLLMNFNFSATSDLSIASTLTTVGGYQVNNIQGLGGGITNSTNIKGFLNDKNGLNDFVINDFFSYLTGNTTTIEFAEIYNSDQKLSDVFNDYYTSSILNNQVPSGAVINNNLVGTTGITISDNHIHVMDGIAPPKGLNKIPLSINNSTRKVNFMPALTTFTTEESYYIPVFIKRNAKQMARLTFKPCEDVITILSAYTSNRIISGGGLRVVSGGTPSGPPSSGPTSPTNIVVGPFVITN